MAVSGSTLKPTNAAHITELLSVMSVALCIVYGTESPVPDVSTFQENVQPPLFSFLEIIITISG